MDIYMLDIYVEISMYRYLSVRYVCIDIYVLNIYV